MSQQSAAAEFITPLNLEESVVRYCTNINKKLKSGKTTEASFYNTLETLVDDFLINCGVINQPKRIECGAPDFIVQLDNIPIGFIEAKDLGENLDEILETEQLERYRSSIGNLILTNYVDFYWVVEGEVRHKISIGDFKFRKVEFHEDAALRLKTFFHTFRFHDTKSIVSSQDLAKRLARSTQNIKLLIEETIEIGGPEARWLLTWLKAFQDTLVSGLDVKQFSDMFAQTMAYGLFTARIYHKKNVEFSRFSAAEILPKTNPFLRRLFAEFTGMSMPQTINWAVEEVIELLKKTDSEHILIEFSKNEGREDPIFHFYETFLFEYDPEIRSKMGVYYTPKPVVDFIVDGVDSILCKSFVTKDGLADANTMLLDPALGTASFLHSAIQHIQTKFKNESDWKSHVKNSLLKRIFGFEILMAPYAVAHLKIGNLLRESNYDFKDESRLGVYLTDSMESAAKKSEVLFSEFISEEANQASKIKKENPIMVVLGNPPYNVSSQNKGEWIQDLVEEYKVNLDEKKINLDDDFIKFIRFAQWRIDKTGHGIVAMITNNTFVDGVTHRTMRKSLMNTFSKIYVLNLHGSAKRKDVENTELDENVFDIQQGVSINFFVKESGSSKECEVYYSELFGTRAYKYQFLTKNKFTSIDWKKVDAGGKYAFFKSDMLSNNDGYEHFIDIKELMPVYSSGIETKRDSVLIQDTKQDLVTVIEDFSYKSKGDLQNKYPEAKDGGGWEYKKAVSHAKEILSLEHSKRPYESVLYRPYDERWTILDGENNGLVPRARHSVMRHMLVDNLGLIICRQLSSSGFQHSFVTNKPIDGNTISLQTKERSYLFPLWLCEDDLIKDKRVNIADKHLNLFKKITGNSRGIEEKIFYYIYAILNSTSYSERYYKNLKIEFPRIPIFNDLATFSALVSCGKELAQLNLMRVEVNEKIFTFKKTTGEAVVGQFHHDPEDKRLYINDTHYFEGVGEEIWNYRVGGFQVLHKWLKDRRKSKLSQQDINCVRKILLAAKEYGRIKLSIEQIVTQYGGWNKVEKDSQGVDSASAQSHKEIIEKVLSIKQKTSKGRKKLAKNS